MICEDIAVCIYFLANLQLGFLFSSLVLKSFKSKDKYESRINKKQEAVSATARREVRKRAHSQLGLRTQLTRPLYAEEDFRCRTYSVLHHNLSNMTRVA